MKHILSLFIVIFPLLISAQESIVIGHKEKLYSETLNEERNYWIYLPPSYQDNNYGKASYPVIYLLDGDTHFTTAVAIQKTFTRGMYNNMPECIIVGILNTDRSRDLTPSKSSFKHNGKVLFENSGGANQFSTFIQQELRGQGLTWKEVTGLVVFKGPGSFTGLRIGITVMNSLAYINGLPIIGVTGERWQDEGLRRLAAGENDTIVMPEYGGEANITKPRK